MRVGRQYLPITNMSRPLSSKLRRTNGHVQHWCPGCMTMHEIDLIQGQWDGDAECPSFSSGIIIPGACHYFIVKGEIIFCGDSTHGLAGKTVPMPDIPVELFRHSLG